MKDKVTMHVPSAVRQRIEDALTERLAPAGLRRVEVTAGEDFEGDAIFIRDRLRGHLPPGAGDYLFGSRARCTASWNADDDLWVDADIPAGVIQAIVEEIDDSFVPFKVDIVTTAELRGQFADRVKAEAIRWM